MAAAKTGDTESRMTHMHTFFVTLTFCTFAAGAEQLVDEVINNLLIGCMQDFG